MQLKNPNVSPEQKSKDGTLPQLLFALDEACKNYSNDEDKSKLANMCIQAASSPIRKYRLLEYFQLLEDNKVQYCSLLLKDLLQIWFSLGSVNDQINAN